MRKYYLRSMVKRFLILFVERSGSTYLATMLDAHPDILAKREEFAHLRQRGVDGNGQIAWARNFWSLPLIGSHKAVGFKTKIVDILSPASFKDLLLSNNVHIIQLQRRNIVKAAVSTINAKRLHDRTGNWNLLDESEKLSAFSVAPDEFDRLMNERIRWDDELAAYVSNLDLPTIKLYYEDLLIDESLFLKKVLDFIDVEIISVKGKTLKNTKDNLRDVVTNLDELRQKYTGTPYEAMFDEVLV